jgi:hypothetical protein
MPAKHRKHARPIATEPETLRRKGPLTLPEIREIRSKATPAKDADKELAKAFTLDGLDEEERAYLTIFRAVYRRCEEIRWDDNAPLEKFIKSLLFHVSFWPMTQDDVKGEIEQSELDWSQREEASRVVQEELNEKRRLQRARGWHIRTEGSSTGDKPSYVLNEYDARGNLAKAVWMSQDQYGEMKRALLDQGCEMVEEKPRAKAAGQE